MVGPFDHENRMVKGTWLRICLYTVSYEDEKLLHLAKLMPMQWCTIAPSFYNTSDEQACINTAPVGWSLCRLENKRKPDNEEAERRKRQWEGKDEAPHQTKFVPAREAR